MPNHSSKWTTDIASLFTSGTNKEIRKIIRDLIRTGEWEGRPASGGHVVLKNKVTGRTTTVVCTPSDNRSTKNTICDIRRAQQGSAYDSFQSPSRAKVRNSKN